MSNYQLLNSEVLLELPLNNRFSVPRLGNVQLRFHFLRRGTSWEIQISDLLGRVVGRYSNIKASSFTLPAATLQKGVYIISLIDSEGKLFTSKLQR